jgi:hypothetical protein
MDPSTQWRLYKSAQLSARSQCAAAFALETCLGSLDVRVDDDRAAESMQEARTSVTLALKHLYAAIEEGRHVVPHLERYAQHVFVQSCEDSAPGPTGATDAPELAPVCHLLAWGSVR